MENNVQYNGGLLLEKSIDVIEEFLGVKYLIYEGSKYVGGIFNGNTDAGLQWYAVIIVKNSPLKAAGYSMYMTHYYKNLSDLTLVLGSLFKIFQKM